MSGERAGVRGEGLQSTDRSATYRNGVLTVIACLLVLLLVQGFGGGGAPEAVAQSRGEAAAPPNAAVQRLQMIRQLESIDGRIGRLEAAVDSLKTTTLKVSVTDMPEVRVQSKE